MAIKMIGPSGEQMLRVASRTVRLAGSSPDAPKLPAELMLLPWGQVRSTNGDFIVDDDSAAAVVAAFLQHGTDLVIDYEHQSLGGRYAAPNGLAPAAGWVTDLEPRPGQGIWGKVRWTLAAARRVLRQEYRFLSPVVVVRKDDRKVMWLDSVALTNRPAIVGMQPVVNRRRKGRGIQGNKADTRVSAGVAADSGHVKEDDMQDGITQLRKVLAMDETAGSQEVLQQACAKLGELIDAARQTEAQQRVACAMEAGKVSEAQKPWAIQFAGRDPAGFEEWVKGAPVLVPLQRIVDDRTAAGDPDHNARRRTVIAAARREYQDNVLLRQLTGERAYIDDALREAGINNSSNSSNE